MRNDRESSQEFYFNDKPVSPWVAWPVIAAVLLLIVVALALLFAIIAAPLGDVSPVMFIAFLLILTGLPVHLALRLFGCRGIYYIERTEWVPVFDDNIWDDDESENDRNRFSISAGEWRRSFTFGMRPWRQAIMRR